MSLNITFPSFLHFRFPLLFFKTFIYVTSKLALDLLMPRLVSRYTDFKHLISQYIFSTWQDDWNGEVTNRLHSVKPVLRDWQSSYRRCRKDEVVLCRVHIGHTYLTHSYILKKDPPPQCEHCQCILTLRHILLECNHLAQTRNDIFGRCGLVESLQFHPELVLIFLRNSDFYSIKLWSFIYCTALYTVFFNTIHF